MLAKDPGRKAFHVISSSLTGRVHPPGLFQEYDPIIIIDAATDEIPSGTVRLIIPKFAGDLPCAHPRRI